MARKFRSDKYFMAWFIPKLAERRTLRQIGELERRLLDTTLTTEQQEALEAQIEDLQAQFR